MVFIISERCIHFVELIKVTFEIAYFVADYFITIEYAEESSVVSDYIALIVAMEFKYIEGCETVFVWNIRKIDVKVFGRDFIGQFT